MAIENKKKLPYDKIMTFPYFFTEARIRLNDCGVICK